MGKNREIILASASPRRKELLSKLKVPFKIMVSSCEEKTDITDPAGYVMSLSRQKAEDVLKACEDEIVIGADTVVAHNGLIMGKPKDKPDAVRMIRSFKGDVHQVYTGVSVAVKNPEASEMSMRAEIEAVLKDHAEKISITELSGNGLIISFSVRTDVFVSDMSEEEIERYVDTGEPMDKAGAYGIQGDFAPFIRKIHGDYYNVVGLPVSALYNVLKYFEIGK